jgi:hypothetical protein
VLELNYALFASKYHHIGRAFDFSLSFGTLNRETAKRKLLAVGPYTIAAVLFYSVHILLIFALF